MKSLSFLGLAMIATVSAHAAAPAKTAFISPQAPAITDDGKAWPEAYFEIFKLAPGKQEAFIRDIARADEVSAAGGQPPIQLFMHEDGADWDVLLFKPETNVKPTSHSRLRWTQRARRSISKADRPILSVSAR